MGTDASVVIEAGEAAASAAAAADVRIAEVHDRDGMAALSAMFDEVWLRDTDAGAIIAPEALLAMSHAGCQVTGAWRGSELVGATAAFIGLAPSDPPGVLHLHSHVTGVVADVAGTGVGWALKQYQRAWALQHGIEIVRWTFDPLIRRNAVFNLVKLAARPIAFREDVYGRMRDARNAGLPTDRVVTEWSLTERRVVAAAGGTFAEPRTDALRSRGAEVILDHDSDGGPRTAPIGEPARGRILLAAVPEDIESMRAADPATAERWAMAARITLGTAIDAGWRVTGFSRDGWYVLSHTGGVEELADRPREGSGSGA